jgi:hypothetical protein
MPARRVLLLLAVLLLMAAVVSSVAEEERTPTPPPQGGTPGRVAGGKPRVVRGRLPADRTVVARVGDVVRVEVMSTRPDEAQVLGLGLDAPTEPGLPGTLEFVADQPGRFAVTLRNAGRRVGVIEIRRST